MNYKLQITFQNHSITNYKLQSNVINYVIELHVINYYPTLLSTIRHRGTLPLHRRNFIVNKLKSHKNVYFNVMIDHITVSVVRYIREHKILKTYIYRDCAVYRE